MAYVTPGEISDFAQEAEALSGIGLDLIAESASRLFDNLCEVEPGFFDPIDGSPVEEERVFYGNGTIFLFLPPYLPGSISNLESDIYEVPDYREVSGMLRALPTAHCIPSRWREQQPVKVTAIWGFNETPADIQEAVIALAIHQWRTADPSWATIAETGENVKIRQIPEMTQETANKYRQKYSTRFIFA